MAYQHIVKTGFWILAVITVWMAIDECNQGRVTEAFATVDDGLRKSQPQLDKISQASFQYFSSYVSVYPTPQNRKALADWEQVQKMQQRYQLYLDSLRAQLIRNVGQPIEKAAKGHCLDMMAMRSAQLRAAILAAADSNMAVQMALPLDFTATANGKYRLGGQPGDFQALPLSGALALISNLETAANLGVITLLDYYMRRSADHGIICNFGSLFIPSVLARKSYIFPDDTYQADIFIQDYAANIEIMRIAVNGNILPIKDNVAPFEMGPGGIGEKSFFVDIIGNIIRQNRNGLYRDTFRVQKEFAYEVMPKWIEVHYPKRSRYFYAGVDNPISVGTVYGQSCNDPKVTASGGILTNSGGGYFLVKPTSLRPVSIEVSQTSTTFNVRPLPDPLPMLAEHPAGGAVHMDQLATLTALVARFPTDFDFPVNCPVVDFQVTRFRAREDPEETTNKGTDFNSTLRRLLQTALPGDRFLFDNIRVQCPGDHAARTISALSLRVL